jgi:uncharacterized protein
MVKKTAPKKRAPARQARPVKPDASAESAQPVRIGVLSDTHGYLDPQVLELFAGVTHIIDAGDVMDPAILRALEAVAPVTAVAGNLDDPKVMGDLPREATGEVDGVRFLVGHKPKRLLKRIVRGKHSLADFDLVVWGHEHVPSATWIDGVLHLSPGTASSPEEEDDGPTVAVVEKTATGLSVRFFPLARRRH